MLIYLILFIGFRGLNIGYLMFNKSIIFFCMKFII